MSPLDPLLELEIRVARRADEIARQQKMETSLNRYCWLMAEAEVLKEFDAANARQAPAETAPLPLAQCA